MESDVLAKTLLGLLTGEQVAAETLPQANRVWEITGYSVRIHRGDSSCHEKLTKVTDSSERRDWPLLMVMGLWHEEQPNCTGSCRGQSAGEWQGSCTTHPLYQWHYEAGIVLVIISEILKLGMGLVQLALRDRESKYGQGEDWVKEKQENGCFP